MRGANRIVFLGDGDIGDVRRLVVARHEVQGIGAAVAAVVAAVQVRGFHGRHHAIGHRARRAGEGQGGLVHHGVTKQRVALHLVIDLANPAAEIERRYRVVGAVEADPVVLRRDLLAVRDGDNAELPTLDLVFGLARQLVLFQQLEDLHRRRALLELRVHQHLVLTGVVGAGLARGHADSRNDHRLHVHQVARRVGLPLGEPLLKDAGGRGDDDLPGFCVDCDHRPGGKGRGVRRQDKDKGEEYAFHVGQVS